MGKVYILSQYIQNVTTGGFTDIGDISYKRTKDSNIVERYSSLQLIKCIASFFKILDNYPSVQNIVLDKKLYDSLLNDFEDYKKHNNVNTILDMKLKEKLNLCNKEELNQELKKYIQNSLTNKEVIKYIKDLIDKKDFYFYDKYNEYTKEQCLEEIKILKHLFKILESVDYKENELGIKEKYISFEPGSYEYENITPFIRFDVYDINHYKRVLELLENRVLHL